MAVATTMDGMIFYIGIYSFIFNASTMIVGENKKRIWKPYKHPVHTVQICTKRAYTCYRNSVTQ